MAMVLRSLYLDPTLDAELASRAEVEGTTKAELMRRFLIEGLGRPAERFSGYAAEAPSAHAQRGVARAAEPRAGYTAESGMEPLDEAIVAFWNDRAEGDELELDVRSGEAAFAPARRETLAAPAPAAPPVRVARGTQRPPDARRAARAVAESPARTAAGGRGDATQARAEQPRRAASPVRSRSSSRSPR